MLILKNMQEGLSQNWSYLSFLSQNIYSSLFSFSYNMKLFRTWLLKKWKCKYSRLNFKSRLELYSSIFPLKHFQDTHTQKNNSPPNGEIRYLRYFSYIMGFSPRKLYWNKITINRSVHVNTKIDSKNSRHAVKLHLSEIQKLTPTCSCFPIFSWDVIMK